MNGYSNIFYLPFNLPPIYFNYPSLYSFFTCLWIIAGIYVNCKFFWMIIYQIKYKENAGMEYFKYGKEYVRNKYNR